MSHLGHFDFSNVRGGMKSATKPFSVSHIFAKLENVTRLRRAGVEVAVSAVVTRVAIHHPRVYRCCVWHDVAEEFVG